MTPPAFFGKRREISPRGMRGLAARASLAATLLLLLLDGVAGFALPAPAACRFALAAARSPAPLLVDMPSDAASFKPLHDYVLVDLQTVPSTTEAGILLPTVYYEFENKNEEAFVDPEPRVGTVVAVGPGRLSGNKKKILPMPDLLDCK